MLRRGGLPSPCEAGWGPENLLPSGKAPFLPWEDRFPWQAGKPRGWWRGWWRKAWNAKKDSGWCYTYPSEKYKSQLGVLFPIYGKIKAMFQTTNQLRVQRFCLPPDNITSTILMFMDKSLWFTVVYMLPPRWSGWSLPNMGTVRTGKMGCPFSDQNLKDTVPKSW